MKATLTTAHRAFTLIEILIGLALLGMLTGGIFSVQRGALEVSRAVIESETRTLQVHALCELLRRNFEQMPGNARVNLQYYGGAGSDLSEVAFTDYPLAFKWPGAPADDKGAVIFRTERSVGGGIGLQAAILYLDEEQADAWSKGAFDESKIQRITILDGIANLRWRFLNDQTQEYEEEWPLTNTRRPTTVEMTLQFMDGTDPVQLIFWIPTMMNPQQFTSGFNSQNPGGPGQPGAGQPGQGPPGGRPGRGEGGRPGRGEGGRPGRDAGASIEFMRPVQGGGPGRGGPGGGRGNR
jgi:prepilin-type N-terminal cleavage/methylation domain-containing protein